MKHLLKMSDLSPEELCHILDVADRLKAEQKAGQTTPLLAGKTVALMFSKNSTRTRTSFEVGVYQLGGLGNYMNAATELQSGRGEPLKDTARVLGRYYDCVVWRTYRQRDLEEFAELAGVPVINGLTDYAHPCQVLADLMTIRERRGALEGQKLFFAVLRRNIIHEKTAFRVRQHRFEPRPASGLCRLRRRTKNAHHHHGLDLLQRRPAEQLQ